MKIKKILYYGKSRRKVSELIIEMSEVTTVSIGLHKIKCVLFGLPDQWNKLHTRCVEIEAREKREESPLYSFICKEIEEGAEFDALVNAMAYFRQNIRLFIEDNPGMKLYENIEGGLEPLEVEDVFWTHDCVPE